MVVIYFFKYFERKWEVTVFQTGTLDQNEGDFFLGKRGQRKEIVIIPDNPWVVCFFVVTLVDLLLLASFLGL